MYQFKIQKTKSTPSPSFAKEGNQGNPPLAPPLQRRGTKDLRSSI